MHCAATTCCAWRERSAQLAYRLPYGRRNQPHNSKRDDAFTRFGMSKRAFFKLLSLVTLLSAGLFAGCERAGAPTDIEAPVPVRPSYTLAGAWNPLTLSAPVTDTTVKVVIGRNGGMIRVRDHVLSVSANAVSENTEFSFRVVGGNTIWVDLTARRVRDGVAVTRFSRTLLLQLSYKGATVAPTSRVFIGYLTEGKRSGLPVNVVENLLTSISLYTETVSALLTHFSEYEIGLD
jgi:hypothetical protein